MNLKSSKLLSHPRLSLMNKNQISSKSNNKLDKESSKKSVNPNTLLSKEPKPSAENPCQPNNQSSPTLEEEAKFSLEVWSLVLLPWSVVAYLLPLDSLEDPEWSEVSHLPPPCSEDLEPFSMEDWEQPQWLEEPNYLVETPLRPLLLCPLPPLPPWSLLMQFLFDQQLPVCLDFVSLFIGILLFNKILLINYFSIFLNLLIFVFL